MIPVPLTLRYGPPTTSRTISVVPTVMVAVTAVEDVLMVKARSPESVGGTVTATVPDAGAGHTGGLKDEHASAVGQSDVVRRSVTQADRDVRQADRGDDLHGVAGLGDGGPFELKSPEIR